MISKMLLLLYFFVLLHGINSENEQHYDTFTGKVISDAEYVQRVKENTTFWCTGNYKQCNAKESRRLDLTCSNLEYPTRGTSHSPYLRELPALFGEGYEPVKKKNGQEMEPARKVRMQTLPDVDIPDQNFTFLFVNYFLFTLGTQTSFHDTINFMVWTPNCCKPEGKKNPVCYPHKIPADDTVHRFSGLRCMNQTRPLTFQSVGCLKDKTSKPQRINSGSNFFDLNLVYGYTDAFRSLKDGMLKVDVENGKIWPVGALPTEGNCLQNGPNETRCHKSGGINALYGMNFFGIIFWREHNFIAEQLQKVNPSWDDDKLFTIAREINIAYFTQIFFYELLSDFMGKENLIKEGILSKNGGLRKTYKKGVEPQLSIEYVYSLRWGHTIMPGHIRMYDSDGNMFDQVETTAVTLRTGYLALDNHFDGMVEGSFRQPMAIIDHAIDPILSEKGLGNLQFAFDLAMADLAKGGLHGINNYVSYRSLCTGKKYETFDDLAEDVSPENIERMKYSHEDVTDVPLMVGIWLEKPIPGGFAPRTLYCITSKQYKRFMQYDRHWFENPDRPNAFNKQQMSEIRKISSARLLCDVGNIKKIQPQAFRREGPGNHMVDCGNITQVNFNAWKDTR